MRDIRKHTHTASDITSGRLRHERLPAGVIGDAVNLGTSGARVLSGIVSNVARFRRLVAGSNISLTEGAEGITITATGGGEGNGYTHPTGFSSQPTTPLTGAYVISQVEVNDEGHVTGAQTRQVSPGDIGAVPSSLSLTIQGTLNQVTSSPSTAQTLAQSRTWTLSLPQNIHTAATPRFARLGLGQAAHASYSLHAAGDINTATNYRVGGTTAINSFRDAFLRAIEVTRKIEWTGSHADRYLRTANFIPGFDLQGGQGTHLGYEDGLYNIYVDNITARKAIRATEFIVDRTRSIMGTEIMSAAHGKVERTETGIGPSNMRVHLEDPDDTGLNPFIGDDRVLIQQINTDSTTIVKHIRAIVVGVGTGTNLYIDLTWQDITPVGIPEPGDSVVQVWHPTDTNRQNIIVRSVTTANGALVYTRNGITSWSDFDQANLPTNNVQGVSYDGLGRFKAYTDSDNYIRKTASALDIRSETFRLDSTQDLGLDIGNTQLRLESGSNFGLRFHIDTEIVYGTPKMLSYGRVFTGLGSSTDRYGIAFFEGSSRVFELSNSIQRIAGWDFNHERLFNTNIELRSGSNARLEVTGTGSNIAGITRGTTSSSILMWAGSTYSGRSSAPFRVQADGLVYAENIILPGITSVVYSAGTQASTSNNNSAGTLTSMPAWTATESDTVAPGSDVTVNTGQIKLRRRYLHRSGMKTVRFTAFVGHNASSSANVQGSSHAFMRGRVAHITNDSTNTSFSGYVERTVDVDVSGLTANQLYEIAIEIRLGGGYTETTGTDVGTYTVTGDLRQDILITALAE